MYSYKRFFWKFTISNWDESQWRLDQSVQISQSVVSDSLQSHGLGSHQASLSITNSWSLLKLMSTESVMPSNCLILCCPLLLLPPVLPSIRVFSSQLALSIMWRYIEASASASILLMNIQGWSLGLTGLISLLSKRLSRVFSSTTVQKHQLFSTRPSLWSNSDISAWLLQKP